MELRPPELLNPEDHERVMGEFAGVIANPGSTSGFVEGRYRHKDGSWRWLEGIGINLLDDPAVNGLLICSRDITERKEAEERERFLSLLTRNSPDFVSVVNPDFSLRYISPSVEPMLGYTQEEFTAFMPSDVIHPDDVEDVMNDMAGAAANPGLNPVREYRIRHKDGSWRWLEAIANNLFHDPGVKALVVNGRDITERKLAQEKERFLSLLIENALDITLVVNPDLSLRYVNPSVEKILGYTPEEFIMFMPSDVIHPEDVKKLAKDIAEASVVGPGTILASQYRYRHKDGSWRWFEAVTNNLLDDPDMRVLIVTLRDITERKLAQEKERFLSLLIENALDITLVVNPDLSLRYVSPSVEKILGYTQEEFVAFIGPADVIHPDDVKDMANDIAEAAAVEPGTIWAKEYRYRHKDGSWRWFEAVANNLLDDPGMRAVVVNLRDITERKEAEAEIIRLNETLECRVAERTAELRESEEQLRTAFEVAAVGMAQTNTNGRYLRANPRLCEMLGHTEEELLARTFREITHSDDLDTELEYVRKMLSGEIKTYSMEKRYLHKDRSRVWVNLSVSLARGPSGEPKYFIQIAEDITKRKEAQRVLQSFTSQEFEVLEHLAVGKTNPQIAASTSFSLGTVKLQVREIFYKLGVTDRTQAAARAVELGLLAPE